MAQFKKLRHSKSEIAPHPQTSRAALGVYELTHVELLRDLCGRASERSTQVPRANSDELQALGVQKLRCWHEGVLVRYGLWPLQLADRKSAQQSL